MKENVIVHMPYHLILHYQSVDESKRASFDQKNWSFVKSMDKGIIIALTSLISATRKIETVSSSEWIQLVSFWIFATLIHVD